VVHALHRIHSALGPGGVIVDTQPVSARPAIQAGGRRLGRLDMSEWLRTIKAVDELVDQTVQDGLYVIEREQQLRVIDAWDDSRECADTVAGWQGTRIPLGLAEKIVRSSPPLTLDQQVRLRLLRAR
jgi:hypothetical protein